MLAVDKIILIVIFLIVLVAVVFIMLGISKPAADNLLLQNELTQCCGTFRAYSCPEDMTSISCGDKTIDELMGQVGIANYDQLKSYCKCS